MKEYSTLLGEFGKKTPVYMKPNRSFNKSAPLPEKIAGTPIGFFLFGCSWLQIL